MSRRHQEDHRTDRAGWLRAAVLGANDGLVSNACLLLGIAAGGASAQTIVLAGTAGLVAGAMSMAAGEYVSVHSQADTEKADLQRERAELEASPAAELRELTAIYLGRGVSPALAEQVAVELMAHDALAAHARDELGITPSGEARPVQAAMVSAASFSVGALVPLLTCLAVTGVHLQAGLALVSFVALIVLGALAAHAGGASVYRGALRVSAWGAAAMAVTAAAGHLFGINA